MKAILVLTAAVVAAATLTASSYAGKHDARTLSDAHVGTSKRELIAQRDYSTGIIRSLAGTWKVAPRHATCWSHVPWSRECDQARRRLLAHRWLHDLAEKRLATLYPARPRELTGSVENIILDVFGPTYGPGAIHVAMCESHFYTGAVNGQYLGIFQMGSHERATYATLGYSTAYEQVVAAHNYFVGYGWGPWSCRP